MKRLAVWIGNGKAWIASEEELEVAFTDRDGKYIVVVSPRPEELEKIFLECKRATDGIVTDPP